MADSSAVRNALRTKLLADGTLMAAATDGVYDNVAPLGARKFVLLAHMAHHDTYTQPSVNAFETFVFLAKVVMAGTTITAAKAGADQLQTLLNNGTLAPTGYTLMRMNRMEHVEYTEGDPKIPETHWQHIGGLYEIVVQPS